MSIKRQQKNDICSTSCIYANRMTASQLSYGLTLDGRQLYERRTCDRFRE